MSRVTRKRSGGGKGNTGNIRMKTARNHMKPKGSKVYTATQRTAAEKRKELSKALQQEKNKCVVLYTKVLAQLENLVELGEEDAFDVVNEIYGKINIYKPTLKAVIPELFPERLELEDTLDYLDQVIKFMRKSIPIQRLSATVANAVIKTMHKKPSPMRLNAPVAAPPPRVNGGPSFVPVPPAPVNASIAELDALLSDLTM